MCGSTRGAATVLSVCRGRVGHAVTWPNLGKASRTVHFFGSAVASTIAAGSMSAGQPPAQLVARKNRHPRPEAKFSQFFAGGNTLRLF